MCEKDFSGFHRCRHTVSYLRTKLLQGGPKSPKTGVGHSERNIDSQVDLCPRACIVLPALLFAPERVKPNQQGCSSAMDLVWEGGGDGVNRPRGVKGEVGVVLWVVRLVRSVIIKEPKKGGRVITLLDLSLVLGCGVSCMDVYGSCVEKHTKPQHVYIVWLKKIKWNETLWSTALICLLSSSGGISSSEVMRRRVCFSMHLP